MYFRFLFLVCCLLLTPAFLYAQPVVHITPQPSWVLTRQPDMLQAPPDQEITYGYYYTIYDEQVHVGLQTTYRHLAYQIVNETGIQAHSQISIPFSGDFQQLAFHKLAILRDGREISKLDRSKIRVARQENELESNMYHGLYQAIILLDDIRKGDMIIIAYSLKGLNPVFKGRWGATFTFSSMTPVMNHYTSIMVPAERAIHYQLYNGAIRPVISKNNGLKIYDWPVSVLSPYDHSRDLSPSWYYNYPYGEFSEYTDWAGVGVWGLTLVNDYHYSLPAVLQQKVDKWYEERDGADLNFVERATRFVQNDIRYLGMEVGEYTHRAHTPAETFNNRYGDCKDKSILLVTMLRSKNIQAWVVLVHTGFREYVTKHLPGAERFNHVIVKAVVQGQTLWIDPTISLQQGRIVNSYIAPYGKGLVLLDQQPRIEPIPLRNAGSLELTEIFSLASHDDSAVGLQVRTFYSGSNADDIRAKLRVGMQTTEREYENYYRTLYGTHAKLQHGLGVEDDTLANTVSLTETYELGNLWEEKNAYRIFDFFARPIYERLVDPAKADGNAPVALVFPLNITYTVLVELPIAWSVNDQPVLIKSLYYDFSCVAQTNGQSMMLTYKLKTFQDHVPAIAVEAYKKDYRSIINSLSYRFAYDKGLVQSIDQAGKADFAGRTNWIAVFVCFVGVTGFFFLFRHLNRKNTPHTDHTHNSTAISGWLILLGIILAIRIPLYIYKLGNADYLRTDVWIALNALGNTGLQLYLLLEMLTMVGLCVYCCWVFYWFMQRRDVFPRMFIWLAFIELGVNLTSLLLWKFSPTISSLAPHMTSEIWKSVFRSVLFVAIWGTAILKSDKVKHTFTRPFLYQPLAPIPEVPDDGTNTEETANHS